MKKIVTLALLSLCVLAGCGSKTPDVQNTKADQKEKVSVEQVHTPQYISELNVEAEIDNQIAKSVIKKDTDNNILYVKLESETTSLQTEMYVVLSPKVEIYTMADDQVMYQDESQLDATQIASYKQEADGSDTIATRLKDYVDFMKEKGKDIQVKEESSGYTVTGVLKVDDMKLDANFLQVSGLKSLPEGVKLNDATFKLITDKDYLVKEIHVDSEVEKKPLVSTMTIASDQPQTITIPQNVLDIKK